MLKSVLKFDTTAVTTENKGNTDKHRYFPNETILASYLISSFVNIQIATLGNKTPCLA
jgi:hypothetical protein